MEKCNCAKACPQAACRHQNGKVIYKYPLEKHGEIIRIKDKFSKFLTVQNQPGVGSMLWAEINPMKEEVEIKVIAVKTGWIMPKDMNLWDYLGTVIDDENDAWHYYATLAYTVSEADEIAHLHDAFAEVQLQ